MMERAMTRKNGRRPQPEDYFWGLPRERKWTGRSTDP